MKHITLLAYPDCAASGIYGAIDVFSLANEWHKQLSPGSGKERALFDWDIVSVDGRPVEGDGKVTLVPHRSIRDVDATDFILIPGFLPPLRFIGNVSGSLTRWLSSRLRRLQTGFVRNYALSVFLGVVIILGYLVLK